MRLRQPQKCGGNNNNSNGFGWFRPLYSRHQSARIPESSLPTPPIGLVPCTKHGIGSSLSCRSGPRDAMRCCWCKAPRFDSAISRSCPSFACRTNQPGPVVGPQFFHHPTPSHLFFFILPFSAQWSPTTPPFNTLTHTNPKPTPHFWVWSRRTNSHPTSLEITKRPPSLPILALGSANQPGSFLLLSSTRLGLCAPWRTSAPGLWVLQRSSSAPQAARAGLLHSRKLPGSTAQRTSVRREGSSTGFHSWFPQLVDA